MIPSRGATTTDFYLGQPVVYIPSHAVDHLKKHEIEQLVIQRKKVCEIGVVKSKNPDYVFVAFYPEVMLYGVNNCTAKACYPRDLFYGKAGL